MNKLLFTLLALIAIECQANVTVNPAQQTYTVDQYGAPKTTKTSFTFRPPQEPDRQDVGDGYHWFRFKK